MSYIQALRDIDRGAEQRTITNRIVATIRAAIESGELGAGERLLPTRDLAQLTQVNHLTAVRSYKRLRELGLVHAKVGSGTYVRDVRARATPGDGEATRWQRFALPEGEGASEDLLVQAMQAAGRPDVVQMALGYPPTEVLPATEWGEHIAAVLADLGGEALQYSTVEGTAALRLAIAELAGEGERAEDVMVVTGATQGLNLAAHALLRPGDEVAVEDPSFIGSLDALRATGARLHGVRVDGDGLDIDMLESVIARHPIRVVVLQSALQNPTGCALSDERARRLTALARRHGFFVVDDEVWAPARPHSERPLSTLRDRDRSHVIAIGSVSKVAGGGLRLGWVRASGPVLDRMVIAKRRLDLASNALIQHAAARWIAAGGFARAMARAHAAYAERLEAFEHAARHIEGHATYIAPQGGGCAWLTLAPGVDEQEVITAAASAGVTLLPGSSFAVEPTSTAHLRVTFGFLSPAEIELGVRRLGHVLRSAGTPRRSASTLPVM